MAYIRKGRIEESIKKGKDNELLTMSALTASFGGECWKSSASEDKNKHIDFYWKTEKGNVISMDAKSHTPKPQDKFHWIEGVNVFGGKGSIYGESDYIAFNANDKVICVKREKLVEVYEKLLDEQKENITTVKPKDFYKLYTRSKYMRRDGKDYNKDIIFMMPDEDMEKLDDTLIINLEND